MRIQKYLSQSGIASRREAEKWMLAGWIRVNGNIVTELGTQIDPLVDQVTVEKPNSEPAFQRCVIAFHKPVGIVTNCPHEGEREIKQFLPPELQSFHAIGRLDKASEGLILLTNDGIVSQRLLNPNHPHERVYEVVLNHVVLPEMKRKLEAGMMLFGVKTQPLSIQMIGPDHVLMRMHEGKNRQIRRMMQKIGLMVLRLKRLSFGPIELGALALGQWRVLTDSEVQQLMV